MTDKPKFEHDACKTCVFLGRHHASNSDLYFCPQRDFPTLISRHSDRPSDYTSGLDLGSTRHRDHCPDMWKATLLALERGLIKELPKD